ncbi:MAG: tRNA (adenosine(37)-N6)-threonylcarbamoyltransferase complex dimerization subunit type 1 TsaB [Eubacteriales bacterium]|nr:tRNA (adenosine(37)-N6)-threonylcarbamoyltransferase complex dimerization subunit type 1 TsaB [Christensenellaceae bacterium]MEA5064968.1 tRNA (adenosine(37)-N6)-threonylcarbamoyltransferase complex dimerization subunit type 1 TsaB [Eubacteriales bacterium]
MIVLAVDASGPVAGVGLMKDERVLYEAVADLGRTHSEALMPMVEAAMSAAGLEASEVDLFAAVAGPGSFTGVRIGVCAVQALSQATGKPCVRLNALEVLCEGQFGFEGAVCPILDARRGQVYAAAFRRAGGASERLMEDAALALDDFLDMLPESGRLLFVGDGVQAHGARIAQRLGERALIAPPAHARIMPSAACRLAQKQSDRATDAAQLRPIYLRAPQAEREREAGIRHG